jgi:hypothetical protein
MYLVLADFSGLCLCNWFKVESAAAFLASTSARSFSCISECPGIHVYTDLQVCVFVHDFINAVKEVFD